MTEEEIYKKFIMYYKEKYKDSEGFTRTQYGFIQFLLKNKDTITQLGDLDSLFIETRYFLKNKL